MSKLLLAVLRRLGREIHVARDGDSALALVRQHRPALLILDLNMPKRGGLEVLRTLRREPDMKDLPILVLSAQGQADTAYRVLEAGASEFLPKPVDTRRFLQRVRLLLGETQSPP